MTPLQVEELHSLLAESERTRRDLTGQLALVEVSVQQARNEGQRREVTDRQDAEREV